jgi:hypothetical protein
MKTTLYDAVDKFKHSYATLNDKLDHELEKEGETSKKVEELDD